MLAHHQKSKIYLVLTGLTSVLQNCKFELDAKHPTYPDSVYEKDGALIAVANDLRGKANPSHLTIDTSRIFNLSQE
jgi:hypothetical protein